MEPGYRGPKVCKAVGITYRQLDHWTRTDLITPSIRDARGSGTQRLYSFTDILQLKVIKKLLDTGISLQQIRKAIDYLRYELKVPIEQVTLVSDGHTVLAATSPTEVVDLLQGGQGVFAIAVGKVYEELQATITALPMQASDEQEPSDDSDAETEAHGG